MFQKISLSPACLGAQFKVLVIIVLKSYSINSLGWRYQGSSHECKFSEILKGNSFIVPLSSEDHFGGVLEKTF